LIVPVGGPLILGLNKPATTGPFSPTALDVSSNKTFHVLKIQFIVYCLLVSYRYKLKAGYP
jgi:hypothetical protein